MSRARTLFLTILPSAIAGGFLFASAFGHAQTGDGTLGYWPTASDAPSGRVIVAQGDPRPAARRVPGAPVPPAAPLPPVAGVPAIPPVPPVPPRRHHPRMSISVHDGKVEVDGIAELVQESLEKALDTLDSLPDVSPEVRDRVKAKIRAVRDKLKVRLSKLKSMDIDKLGPEMERIGDDIEHEMAGLDQDLAQLGDKLGKGIAQKFGKEFAKNFGPGANPGHDDEDGDDDGDDDDSDKDAVVVTPGRDAEALDGSDLGPAIAALKGLSLDARQRADLARLRAESDGRIQQAKRELAVMSSRLHDTLRDSSANEVDITHQIDAISTVEATIRKERILSWLKARSLLRKDQRQKVEDAVRRGR